MKKVMAAFCLILALLFCVSAGAEMLTLEEVAAQLSALEVDGFEFTAKYHADNRLFMLSMKSTAVTPVLWEMMDDAKKMEFYLAYIQVVIDLEDMIRSGGYKDVAVTTSFQLTDGTPVYLTINGIDCAKMIG